MRIIISNNMLIYISALDFAASTLVTYITTRLYYKKRTFGEKIC